MSLNNKRVLVVGGSSGIGLQTAVLCQSQGAEVTIVGRSRDKLDAAERLLKHNVSAYSFDAKDDGAVASFFDKQAAFDHVVICAAVFKRGSVRDCDVDTAKSIMEDKFWIHYRVSHYAKINESGSLLIVGGNRSEKFTLQTGLLSIMQASLEAMAKQLVLELAPIRVNLVSPGVTATPIHNEVFGGEDKKQEVYKKIGEGLPVKRIGRAEEIAALIVHVLLNEYINGSVLVIDGGELVV